MTKLESDFTPIRQELLGHLEGKILDVGCGTGVNFKHFNKNSSVIAVEPSIYMLEKANKKLPQHAQITTHNLSVTDPKLEHIIAEKSLDYIVCTLVLCTIPDVELALNKFKNWLKPFGKLIILEHIHAEKSRNKLFQNIINPVWKIVGDGCNLNKSTDQLIKSFGFKVETDAYFKKTLRFYKGVFSLK